MELRDHPLMSHRGVRNWPPKWTTTRNDPNDRPRGEIGILTQVLKHTLFEDKLFLVIQHDHRRYMAALTFDDGAFCAQLYIMLKSKIGSSIREIGSLDVSHTL
jgi:hypothetical protein